MPNPSVSSLTSTLGTSAIAANAVANNLDNVGCIVGQAMELAMITVVGRCIGAGDPDQAVHYTKKLMLWDYVVQGVANALVIVGLPLLMQLYTLSPQTDQLSRLLVIIHCGCGILLWPAAFVLPNALRAANDVRFTMFVSVFSMVLWRLGFSYVLCVNMKMGAVGVWIAMVIDWVFRVLCFVVRFARKKLRTRALPAKG